MCSLACLKAKTEEKPEKIYFLLFFMSKTGLPIFGRKKKILNNFLFQILFFAIVLLCIKKVNANFQIFFSFLRPVWLFENWDFAARVTRGHAAKITVPVPQLRDAKPACWVTSFSICASTLLRAQNRAAKGSILL